MNDQFTQEDLEALRGLRHRGFAVAVWTPEEIGSMSRRHLEDAVVEHGNMVIEMSQDEDEDDA